MILDIIQYGHPTLRKKAQALELPDTQLEQLIPDMLETMRDAQGIGLAAPQINQALRLAVIELEEDETNTILEFDGETTQISDIMPLIFINPEVKLDPKNKEKMQEGCLSIQNLQATVLRPTLVEMTYLDPEGKQHTLKCDGLLGRAIQHEYDHLEGVLFTDRVSSLQKKKVQKQLQSLLKPKSAW